MLGTIPYARAVLFFTVCCQTVPLEITGPSFSRFGMDWRNFIGRLDLEVRWTMDRRLGSDCDFAGGYVSTYSESSHQFSLFEIFQRKTNVRSGDVVCCIEGPSFRSYPYHPMYNCISNYQPLPSNGIV